MSEIDRFTYSLIHQSKLIFIIDMLQLSYPLLLVIASKLNRWESELVQLDVIVDLIIKVLAHVGFHYHGEMVTIPLI